MIIPVLNDRDALSRLLQQLAAQVPRPAEVLVVDGAPTRGVAGDDSTEMLCATQSARYLPSQPGRGRQLRAGAAAARGAVLWFLHADAQLPDAATAAIARSIAAGGISGYFQFRFSGSRTWTKRIIEYFVSLRCRYGTVYGDQGIFVRRADYDASPGFAATPLFEEVPLIAALKRKGRMVALPEAIAVDCRRWERRGYWRQTALNRLLAVGYALGIPPERLAAWYRGKTGPREG